MTLKYASLVGCAALSLILSGCGPAFYRAVGMTPDTLYEGFTDSSKAGDVAECKTPLSALKNQVALTDCGNGFVYVNELVCSGQTVSDLPVPLVHAAILGDCGAELAAYRLTETADSVCAGLASGAPLLVPRSVAADAVNQVALFGPLAPSASSLGCPALKIPAKPIADLPAEPTPWDTCVLDLSTAASGRVGLVRVAAGEPMQLECTAPPASGILGFFKRNKARAVVSGPLDEFTAGPIVCEETAEERLLELGAALAQNCETRLGSDEQAILAGAPTADTVGTESSIAADSTPVASLSSDAPIAPVDRVSTSGLPKVGKDVDE